MPSTKKRTVSAEDLYKIQGITSPRLSPDGRHVVYAQQRVDRKTEKKYANLWVVPTAGGTPVQFTFGDQIDGSPRWSPDGSTIAFLSNRGDKEKPAQVYLISFGGGEARPLTNLEGEIGDLAWSPDGRKLLLSVRKKDPEAIEREKDEQKKKLGVVARHYDRLYYKLDGYGYLPHERWHIWTVDARTNPGSGSTGKAKQITDGPVWDELSPTWSPDGKWIAYHCRQGGETRICVVSLDGQPAGEPISGTTPAWSPASQDEEARLAFLCFQDSHSDICTARPDGTELANLTNSPADEHTPAWSPDGNWLAFVSNRGIDVDVYKVCATCPGEPAALRLTDEPRAAGWPAWSPDGDQVAYVDTGGQDLMLVNADRSDATYLSSGVFGPPIWKP